MNIAKLTISYDRGLAHNDKNDLAESSETTNALFGRGSRNAAGHVIRGLGTHYRSEGEMVLVQEREKDAKRIYMEFRKRFLATPLEGVYVVGERGEAKAFCDGLAYRDDIQVFVTEFELTAPGELNTSELRMWGEKIKRQLSSISIGRCKEADEAGLKALERLADCPVLSKGTGLRIKELVAGVRAQSLDRVELKRGLEKMTVEIEQAPLSPRRMPRIA